MDEYFSITAGTKAASTVTQLPSPRDEITITASSTELRHRRNRHSSDDGTPKMDSAENGKLFDGKNQVVAAEINGHQSPAFEVDSYRPLKSILKSPNNGLNKDLVTDDEGTDENSLHYEAQKLNWNSAEQRAEVGITQSIHLPTIPSSLDEYGDVEFVGEFTPRSGGKDVELEPLLSGGDMDLFPTSGDNKAFSSDGEDEMNRKPHRISESKKLESTQLNGAEVDESALSILLQVSLPFFIAGCGTVGAGLVLDKVQHHRVFEEVPQIFILVPALLGLKGNLEMTLASRLSTLANLGRMDTKKEKMKQIVGNLSLIQAQAAVIAFMAAMFAVILGWIPKGEFNLHHALVLCASSLATASLASLILGVVMVAVVLASKSANINPDNVATPIAASLGDLTTLSLLAAAGSLLVNANENGFWLAPFLVALFILLCPLWIWISAKNPSTREVLISGWSPVIFSMLISSAGGFILEYTVGRYRGIAVFQPVINGIGGNLVAVQASRISTSLHRGSRLGSLPSTAPDMCFNPFRTFYGSKTHAKAARVLLAMVVPGHLVFMYMIHFLRAGHTPITPTFAVIYCTAALIQVVILLYVCVTMVHYMWKEKIDPDNSAIPYLTALGDLLGTALLAAAFYILSAIGGQEEELTTKE